VNVDPHVLPAVRLREKRLDTSRTNLATGVCAMAGSAISVYRNAEPHGSRLLRALERGAVMPLAMPRGLVS
jgi:hypothetical protein